MYLVCSECKETILEVGAMCLNCESKNAPLSRAELELADNIDSSPMFDFFSRKFDEIFKGK